jgi:hypothetical protein
MHNAQIYFTLVYNKENSTKVWKLSFGCGKLSGKSAKLQQNRVEFPLFHASRGWKSGK